MTLHNEIIDRVKKRLGIVAAPQSNGGAVDFLVKMNLSPLMGRRDAAIDRACETIREEVFAMTREKRQATYAAIARMLRDAIDDTNAILQTLTSPDTESRERQLLLSWELLLDVLTAMQALNKLDLKIFSGDNDSVPRFLAESPMTPARNESLLNEGEITLVTEFRELCDELGQRLERYREYARKSFSKSNADRYAKAYEEYARFYRTAGAE